MDIAHSKHLWTLIRNKDEFSWIPGAAEEISIVKTFRTCSKVMAKCDNIIDAELLISLLNAHEDCVAMPKSKISLNHPLLKNYYDEEMEKIFSFLENKKEYDYLFPALGIKEYEKVKRPKTDDPDI